MKIYNEIKNAAKYALIGGALYLMSGCASNGITVVNSKQDVKTMGQGAVKLEYEVRNTIRVDESKPDKTADVMLPLIERTKLKQYGVSGIEGVTGTIEIYALPDGRKFRIDNFAVDKGKANGNSLFADGKTCYVWQGDKWVLDSWGGKNCGRFEVDPSVLIKQ